MTAFWSAIVNDAILSAAFTLIVALILRLVSRRALNAATRYAIWWIVLAVTIVLPLSYVSWRTTQIAPSTPQTPIANFALTAPAQDLPPAPARIVSSASRTLLPIEIPASPWLKSILILWGATSALLLLRLLLSHIALHRRIARATNARPEWNAHIRQWMGPSRRHVRLAISNDIAIPAASGPINPTILIPTKLFNQLSPEDLEQIARHEAAHLVRYDDCALLLQRIIEALFALHPVVRYLTRQLDLEREVACDDVVAGSDEQARTYADCLTRTVALCGGVRNSLATANVADSRSHFSRRVTLLVSGTRTCRTAMLRGQLGIIAIMLICLAGMLTKTPQLLAFVPTIAKPAPPVSRFDSPLPLRDAIVLTPPIVHPPRIVAQAVNPPAPAPAQPTEDRITHLEYTIPLSQPVATTTRQYVLGPNDVVGVSVWNDKNLTNSYSIGPDGMISMYLIGDFKASGLTIPRLRDTITEKLRDWLNDPLVNVQLLANNSKKYTVVGAILKPGPYPLERATTILDALAASGGFMDYANKTRIVLIRGTSRHLFDYSAVVRGENLEQNITLEDGDIISVPGDDR